MKYLILLLVTLSLIIPEAFGQIMFQKHYGGIGDDFGCQILQTNGGGYFVAALTESFGAGGREIYLIKTNEYGDFGQKQLEEQGMSSPIQ